MSTVTGMGRVGIAILEAVIVFGFSYLFGVSKVSTVTGMGRVGIAILEAVIVFGFSCLVFWLLISFWRVKSVNSHRDGAGRGRHPRNCDRFWLLMSLGRVKNVSTVTGMGRVGVAILETVIVFGFSCLLGVSKVSTVTGMRRAPPKRQKPKN